jgi:hypothetical protein
MANGYKMFAKLHPAGGLYRYKGDVNYNNPSIRDGWQVGKVGQTRGHFRKVPNAQRRLLC